MKNIFWIIALPMSFLLAGSALIYQRDNADNHAKILNANKGNGTLLVYIGNMSGTINRQQSIHFEIDPAVGFRSEIAIENGDQVMAHHAFFVKFSDPGKGYFYNYLNHQVKMVPTHKGGSSDNTLSVVGQETVAGYPCTHLRVDNSTNPHHEEDYWMSTKVPGYKMVSDMLSKHFNQVPGMNGFLINEWGLMVKMTIVEYYDNGGIQLSASNLLQEANPNMSFPKSDFEVPKK